MMPPSKLLKVSPFDQKAYYVIRKNVDKFLRQCAQRHDKPKARILDIAPQIHKGAKYFFNRSVIETLDIDPFSGATHIGDITQRNRRLASGIYDVIICTEVLEHTLNPFAAVQEVYRLLKPRGHLCLSVPFNFRIHGPLPDCWRFTEHGLKALLRSFKRVQIAEIKTPGRNLMPIHYTVIARK